MYIYVYAYLYIHQTPFCIGSCPVFSKFSRGEEPLKVLLKRAMQKDEKMNHRNLEIELFSTKFTRPKSTQDPIHA